MTPSIHNGRSPAFAIEAAEQDEEEYNNKNSGSGRRKPQQSTAPTSTPPVIRTPLPTTTSSNRAQHTHNHHHHLPLNVLLSGWTKLEAVQRWVLERTLEYMPHPHYHLTMSTTSAAVQRVLQDEELVQLERKYKDQIKVDPEIQALQKQIRTTRQQLHNQKRERERLEKKHLAQRERDQKALDGHLLKLKQALEATEKTSGRREYSKALQRAGHRKNQTGKRQNSFYKKIIAQPLTALAGSTSTTCNTTNSTNWATGAIEEKEALALETTILRTMHQTLVYQNQCDVAQKHDQLLTSSLKRSRAQVDNDRADIYVFQMVLEGTTHALAGLYPEIVARQEHLMERLHHGRMKIVPRRSIPRVIVPKLTGLSSTSGGPKHKRLSFTSSVSNNSSRHNHNNNNLSISDLGESVETDDNSSKDYYYSSSYDHDAPFATSVAANGYSRSCFPVFTSVETLQQQTLQHLADVGS